MPKYRLKTETIVVESQNLTRSYQYDATSNLTLSNDRQTRYTHDKLNRLDLEGWLDNTYDDNGNCTHTRNRLTQVIIV